MLDDAELRRMSPEDRARLSRALTELDTPEPLADPTVQRRQRLGAVVLTSCCLGLAGWIAVLAITLPRHYAVGAWRAAWIGFDVGLLGAFAATAWAAWRRRQVLIPLMIVTATLLGCDAWFDVTLDWRTTDFWVSLISALAAELPLAILLLFAARRLLHITLAVEMAREGYRGPVPSLWRLSLFGTDLGRTPDAEEPDPAPT